MENNLKERLTILLPTDEEVEQWYSDNIDESIATVSNSIYKFRLYLNDRAKSTWISVKTKLPDIGEEYNVVMDLQDGLGNPVSSTLEYDSISKKWTYPGTDIEVTNVIYWQPLPLPPGKEVEGE